MNRIPLAGLFACLCCSLPSTSAQVPKVDLRVAKLGGNVFVIDDVRGSQGDAGGNVLVLVGNDGIVLVDAMMPYAARELRAALDTVSTKPVRFLINTHGHADHAGGNATLARAGAVVIAHEKARAKSAEDRPDIAVAQRLTLNQNDETVEIRHYPHAHSDADLVVHLKSANVVHLGDIYFAGMFPIVDPTVGRVDTIVAVLEEVLANTDAAARFVPGHGPVSTRVEVKAYLDMLKETRAIAAAGIKAGKTVEQVVDPGVRARFDRWAEPGYTDTSGHFRALYAMLKNGMNGRPARPTS